MHVAQRLLQAETDVRGSELNSIARSGWTDVCVCVIKFVKVTVSAMVDVH